MSLKESILTLFLFMFVWYMLLYQALLVKSSTVEDSPLLRNRFGTILWHSADPQGGSQTRVSGEFHLYCYYPKNVVIYDDKRGEYIIKRVSNLNDCKNWYGSVVLEEGSWVSEREKIWWSKDQKLEDNLVSAKQQVNNI